MKPTPAALAAIMGLMASMAPADSPSRLRSGHAVASRRVTRTAPRPSRRYPQMVTSSPADISAWNRQITARKQARHLARLQKRMNARMAGVVA